MATGFLIHVGMTALCPHGGQVAVIPSNTRVRVGGQFAATASDTFTIAGCPFQVPIGTGTKPQPCVTLQWIVPAVRVRISGQPAVLATSTGLCQSAEQIPQGPPNIAVTQIRVKGT
jgi:hypothetical protein